MCRVRATNDAGARGGRRESSGSLRVHRSVVSRHVAAGSVVAGCIWAALVPAGCTRSVDGLEVAVEYRVRGHGRLETANGSSLSLESAYASFAELELLPCESDGPSFAERLRILVTMPTAHAHAQTSPTRLPGPHVIDLLAPDDVRVGKLRPPPGPYCAIQMTLEPAGLEALPPDDPMAESSLYLEGTLSDDEPFVVRSAARRRLWRGLDPPLALDPARRRGTVTFVFDPAGWLGRASREALESRGGTGGIVTGLVEGTRISLRQPEAPPNGDAGVTK